jgi:hypothetical protein
MNESPGFDRTNLIPLAAFFIILLSASGYIGREWWKWQKQVDAAQRRVMRVASRFNRVRACLIQFDLYCETGLEPDEAATRALEDNGCL